MGAFKLPSLSPDPSLGQLAVRQWPDIAPAFTGYDSAILLGNGASRAVSSRLAYPSLFEKAKAASWSGLSMEDEGIFHALKTTNFETVLSALRTAVIVFKSLDKAAAKQAFDRYTSIRAAMIEAVSSVHPEWAEDWVDRALKPAGYALRSYGSVFSTNYDLLLYWAMMRCMNDTTSRDWFNDCFRRVDFVVDDAVRSRPGVRVLFLHGALHLYRDVNGETRKLQYEEGQSILDLFGQHQRKNNVPLFVAEGTAEDKERAIRSSDYLSYANLQYEDHAGPVTVFGHSLGTSDQHLVRPLKRRPQRRVAVSILVPGKTSFDLVELVAQWKAKLAPTEPVFFDATTHPLGSPNRRVD